jgi:hypothetical protein
VTNAPRRYVVHPSVIAQLWQYPGQFHDAAHDLLQDMAGGRIRLTAFEGIELRVLNLLVRYFRDVRPEPLVSLPLFMDVKSQHALMTRLGFMELISASRLDASAFVLAARHGLSFDDALTVTLAERDALPLLLADEGVRRRLKNVFVLLQRTPFIVAVGSHEKWRRGMTLPGVL